MKMESQNRGGLFPANIDAFNALIDRALSEPRLPRLTPEERVAGDQYVKDAIKEKGAKQERAQQRIELAKIISTLCYDELIAETGKAAGTESTRQTYRNDFNRIESWCRDQHLPALPTSPEVLAFFIITQAQEFRPERLQRVISAIKYFHNWAEQPLADDDVQVKAALRFVRRCAEEQRELDKENPTKLEPEPQNINGSGQPH
jgi:hypothetical protein